MFSMSTRMAGTVLAAAALTTTMALAAPAAATALPQSAVAAASGTAGNLAVDRSAVTGSMNQTHLGASAPMQTQPDTRPAAANDFRVPGVRIWSQPARSTILGLGYPGQGFDTDGWRFGQRYTCDNGETTTIWDHGRNRATGVVGWVPVCNLRF